MLCLGFPSSEVGRRGPTHRAAVTSKREGTSTRSQLLLGPAALRQAWVGILWTPAHELPPSPPSALPPAVLRHAEVVVQSRGPQG